MSASRGRYAALLMAAMVFAVCLLVPALMLRDSGAAGADRRYGRH